MMSLDVDLLGRFDRMATRYLDGKTWKDFPKAFFDSFRSRTAHYNHYETIKLVQVCPVCGHDSFIPISRNEEKSDNSFFPGMMNSYMVVCAKCGELEVGYSRSLLFVPQEEYRKGAFVGESFIPDKRFVGVTIEQKAFIKKTNEDSKTIQGIRKFVLGK